MLTSDVFIPIAEDTGTIGKMTDLLIERAMRDAKDWPEHLSVSVNFSPRQISDPNVATRILGLLTKVGFPPHRLVMEITEGAVVQKLEAAKAVLQSLRNVGVRIALDDFGTGYSGLYHLRELELDIVKIDRSFVGEILNKPEEARIVKAMLSLGHALGLHDHGGGNRDRGGASAPAQARLRCRPRLSVRRPRARRNGDERSQGGAFPPATSPSAATAPSPSAGLRAAARIPPWRWSWCPA